VERSAFNPETIHMWINPNHSNPPRQPSPPAESGLRRAKLPRRDGREELRVNLAEYQGRPYLAVRLWQRDQSGAWWPTRKGVSIRLSEARDVADALAKALDRTGY
jgi:hypothetical protein